jgi:hypothetical protein
MRKFAMALVLGIVIGVGASLAVVALHPSASWQERAVRAHAESIGCSMSVGLHTRCVRVADLRRGDGGAWLAIFGDKRRACYELDPSGVAPHRRACP